MVLEQLHFNYCLSIHYPLLKKACSKRNDRYLRFTKNIADEALTSNQVLRRQFLYNHYIISPITPAAYALHKAHRRFQ